MNEKGGIVTTLTFQTVGVIAGAIFLAVLIWSTLFPSHRIWPPRRYSRYGAIFTWLGTLAIFGAALWLGIADWARVTLPDWSRYGVGLVAVIVGNLIVWPGAIRFGFDQTSGAKGDLMTDGVYRFSRHPQYVGDILILVGWAMFSASLSALPVIAIGVTVLVAAPFVEEPWLRQTYGERYRDYERRTQCFFGLPREISI